MANTSAVTQPPVVGKRFNPYLYIELIPQDEVEDYGLPVNQSHKILSPHSQNSLRFGYGHESNGQRITSEATYQADVTDAMTLHPNQQRPLTLPEAQRQTLDYISRGWDYLGISWTARPKCKNLSYEIAYRRYLRWGFLEHNKEEYLSWEKEWYGQQLTRNDVSGLAVALDWYLSGVANDKPGFRLLKFVKLLPLKENVREKIADNVLVIDRLKGMGTMGGNVDLAKNKGGIKLLAVTRVFDFRFLTTYSYGYDSDIAQYGKLNHSVTVGLLINAFGAPKALTGGGLN